MTSYGDAGVDLKGAARHVARISEVVQSTWKETVIGAFGGFAAGVELPSGYRHPVLMMSTDGVGTKLELARQSGLWDGVGYDLVAMCVDDLAAAGADPIGFVDYLAVGGLDAERDQKIVSSIAAACLEAGVPLLGGETAEHPGVMSSGAIDLAGAALGVVEKGSELGPQRVERGDVVLGLPSPNLRSNGFSLVRSVFGEMLADHYESLLAPSVIYAPGVIRAIAAGGVHAAAHITGGGIVENLARVIPDGLGARIDTATWDPPDVFALVEEQGVTREEMFRTFNMGIGFCLVVGPDAVERVSSTFESNPPITVGEIAAMSGVDLV